MNAANISIRPAIEQDLPAILEFVRGLAEYERLADSVTATEERLRETLFGEHRYAEVLIGSIGDCAAGFALFFHNYSTFLAQPGIYLEDLFVLPEHRGSGLGKALLTELARIAVERNCGRLEWAVLDWNEPAIKFYKGLGAAPLHDWTVFRLTGEALQSLASRAGGAR